MEDNFSYIIFPCEINCWPTVGRHVTDKSPMEELQCERKEGKPAPGHSPLKKQGKKKLFILKTWGFNPRASEGDKSNVKVGYSLSSQFSNSCQKTEVTMQLQNKLVFPVPFDRNCIGHCR